MDEAELGTNWIFSLLKSWHIRLCSRKTWRLWIFG